MQGEAGILDAGGGNAVTTPVRIQRERTKGWRMPPNTVYVGKPTIYGNPFWLSLHGLFKAWWDGRGWIDGTLWFPEKMDMLMGAMFQTEPHPLRGKNLACWCPIDLECHADLLLDISNSR